MLGEETGMDELPTVDSAMDSSITMPIEDSEQLFSQGSSIDGAGAGRLKLMKINSLGEESQADSLVFEDTQDGRDNSRSDNTDASTDVYDNLSAPAENSLDVGTNDVDDDEPPPLDDRPPVSENIIGDAQDAHKANGNDDSDDEPPPLDEMPPQSGDVAHGTPRITMITADTRGESHEAPLALNVRKSKLVFANEEDSDDDVMNSDDDGAAGGPSVETTRKDPKGKTARGRSKSEGGGKGPRAPTEKQRKKEQEELLKRSSKMVREGANVSLKVIAPVAQERGASALFAHPLQPARARSRSTSTLPTHQRNRRQMLLARVPHKTLTSVPKLGGGARLVPVRASHRPSANTLLQGGGQITLLEQDLMKLSPRKLGLARQEREHVSVGAVPGTKRGAVLARSNARRGWQKNKQQLKQCISTRKKEDLQRHQELARMDEEEGYGVPEEEMAFAENLEEEEEGEEEDGEEEEGEEEHGEDGEDGEDGEGEAENDDTGSTDVFANGDEISDTETVNESTSSATGDTAALDTIEQESADADHAAVVAELAHLAEVQESRENSRSSEALFKVVGSSPNAEDGAGAAVETQPSSDDLAAKPTVGSAVQPNSFFRQMKVTATAAETAKGCIRGARPPPLSLSSDGSGTTTPSLRPGTPLMGTPNACCTPDLFDANGTPTFPMRMVLKPKARRRSSDVSVDDDDSAATAHGAPCHDATASARKTLLPGTAMRVLRDGSASMHSLDGFAPHEVSQPSEAELDQSQFLNADGFVVDKTTPRVSFPSHIRANSNTSVVSASELPPSEHDVDMDELLGLCSGKFPTQAHAPTSAVSTTPSDAGPAALVAENADTTGKSSGGALTEENLRAVESEHTLAQDDETATLDGNEEEEEEEVDRFCDFAEHEGGFIVSEAEVSGDSEDEEEEVIEQGGKGMHSSDDSVDGEVDDDTAENDNAARRELDEEAEDADLSELKARFLRTDTAEDDSDDDKCVRAAKRAAEQDAEHSSSKKSRKKRRRKKKRSHREASDPTGEEGSQLDLFAADAGDNQETQTAFSEPEDSADENQVKYEEERLQKAEFFRTAHKEDSVQALHLTLLDETSRSHIVNLRTGSGSRFAQRTTSAISTHAVLGVESSKSSIEGASKSSAGSASRGTGITKSASFSGLFKQKSTGGGPMGVPGGVTKKTVKPALSRKGSYMARMKSSPRAFKSIVSATSRSGKTTKGSGQSGFVFAVSSSSRDGMGGNTNDGFANTEAAVGGAAGKNSRPGDKGSSNSARRSLAGRMTSSMHATSTASGNRKNSKRSALTTLASGQQGGLSVFSRKSSSLMSAINSKPL